MTNVVRDSKKLKLVGSVSTKNLIIMNKLIEVIQSKKTISQEIESSKPIYKYIPLDITDVRIWSSYDECRLMKFYIVESENGDRLMCNVCIFDGDNIYGNAVSIRFTAKIQLPITFITNISNLIESYFETYLIDKFDEYEVDRRSNWIAKKRLEILKN